QISASKVVDFIVNEKYHFEIGGKNKTNQQIKNLENACIVKDTVEIGSDNVIPLWLFGFLY
ncbi:MAG: AAA family ATPase, partial [Bacteroidales bacterium]|nr:AAA family ATPase [Bacteroidales bacterium]